MVPNPSTRKNSAQRAFSSTILICEALIVFFATLVVYGLNLWPDQRMVALWVGVALSLLLILTCGRLRSKQGYYMGYLLQVPLVIAGFYVPMLLGIAVVFLAFWIFGLYSGAKADREKDLVDAAYYEQHPEDRPTA